MVGSGYFGAAGPHSPSVHIVSTHIDLPKAFRERIIAARRGDGARWLESLPDVVATLAEQWDLRLGEPFEPSWSYVVSAQRATGEACVLKIEPPARTKRTSGRRDRRVRPGRCDSPDRAASASSRTTSMPAACCSNGRAAVRSPRWWHPTTIGRRRSSLPRR